MKQFIFIFLCFFISRSLQAESFTIETYDVQITISERGYFDVMEVIRLNFNESRRGIIRSIPLKANLGNHTQQISINRIKVDDKEFKTFHENGYEKIQIGQSNKFVTGAQRYVIRYRVYDAFDFSKGQPIFDWNLIGDQWNTTIDSVAFAIILPENIQMSEEMFSAVGGDISIQNVNFSSNTFYGETIKGLDYREGVRVTFKLPEGSIAKPVSNFKSKKSKKDYSLLDVLVILGSFILFIMGMFFQNQYKNDAFGNDNSSLFEDGSSSDSNSGSDGFGGGGGSSW